MIKRNVDINKLSFAYADDLDTKILDGLDVKIDSGEFVCILGQSGCGKSTLLKLLAGLQMPTEGSIEIYGKAIKGASLDKAVVFQDYGLFPWMTTVANIMLALEQRFPGKSKSEYDAQAREALRQVGLKEDSFDRFPKALSGGMKQRTAIARAFIIDSPILLMDEPFGALDAVTRTRLQEIVLDLWKKDEEKKTVFFITHDVDEALMLATRILVLSQSPARVIFDEKLDPERPRDRESIYEDKAMIALQSELVRVINVDIAHRASEMNEEEVE